MNKIAFITTAHCSKKLRPNGKELIMNYLDSLKDSCNYDYKVYVMDNGSENPLNIKSKNVKYFYMKNQFKEGITGAWNKGINKAINDGSEIIINTNDDIQFNSTINEFIKIIIKHPFNDVGLYSPVCNKGGCSTNHQIREKSENRIIETTDYYALNGYFLGFTREMYYNFLREDGNLFSSSPIYKWRDQENEFYKTNTKKGMRSFIIENCFVRHFKYKGWQKLEQFK